MNTNTHGYHNIPIPLGSVEVVQCGLQAVQDFCHASVRIRRLLPSTDCPFSEPL